MKFSEFTNIVSVPFFRLFRFMDYIVSTGRQKHQVFWSIIRSFSVNMMDVFCSFKRSFQNKRYNVTMLRHQFTVWKSYIDISMVAMKARSFISFFERKIFPVKFSSATFRTTKVIICCNKFFITSTTFKRYMTSPFNNRSLSIPSVIFEFPQSFGKLFFESLGFYFHGAFLGF